MIIRLLFSWFLSAMALVISAYFFDSVTVDNYLVALFVPLVITFANATIRPIIRVLAIPLSILTLGLFTFVINGFIVWLCSLIVPGFTIDGFLNAIWFSIVLSIVNALIDLLIYNRRLKKN